MFLFMKIIEIQLFFFIVRFFGDFCLFCKNMTKNIGNSYMGSIANMMFPYSSKNLDILNMLSTLCLALNFELKYMYFDLINSY